MTRWQPDPEYYNDNTGPLEGQPTYNWNWCEVDGFIKLPDYDNSDLQYFLGQIAEYYDGYSSAGIDPLQRSDVHCDLPILSNARLYPGVFVPFRLRISCYEPDQSKLNSGFSLVSNYSAAVYNIFDHKTYRSITVDIPAQNIYGTLSLKDMKPFFQLDTQNYTLTLDPKYSTLPVGDYEYGYAGGTDFKPLSFGANYLEPGSGDVVVRYKSSPWLYITVGTITPPVQGSLAIAGRTPTTASLAWSAPSGSEAPTSYDIYRQKVDWMSGFSPNIHIVDNTFNTALKVGSTTGLTFTDQGLSCDVVYAYYVVANYAAGNINESNTVRTDSVTMQGLPPTPGNLRVDLQTQSTLTLSWQCQQATNGIKEYIIYRGFTQPTIMMVNSKPYVSYLSETPIELGRSSGTSFTDSGLAYEDQCEYSVQTVDENGIPSLISAPVTVTIPDLTPPTAPGNLQAGDVLRQGDSVQYAFPESTGIRNVILGPRREVALRWDPSTVNADIAALNVGVVAYDVYRSVVGYNAADNAFWGEQNKLVGSTTDTSFIDSGLEFGATYTYYVKALDSQGNTSASNPAYIGTEKSTLSGLTILSGSQTLTPDPAFAYYQTEYTLNVDNTVTSISLTPVRTDPDAQVTVNGAVYNDQSTGPLALDPGKNVFTIEVVPRRGAQWFITPETTDYTLTVNRPNLDHLPVLTLPEGGTVNEGDTYMAAGRIAITDNLVWTGTADYGDGAGATPLQLHADGSFTLAHQYLDTGQYQVKVSFRYQDLGLVTGTLEVTVKNVAPTLTVQGTQDDVITTPEGAPLTITGNIIDPGLPGHDSWTVTGDYGSGPAPATVDQTDKTFTFQNTFYDLQPAYDLALTVVDKDGGSSTAHIKIIAKDVPPSVQAGGPVLAMVGVAFTGTGSFTAPGLETWQASVDYGDGSGQQPLAINQDKTFGLNHIYLKTGSFTVTVRVEDSNGGTGSASFPVKVKDYLFTIQAEPDTSIKAGDTLKLDDPVQGWPNKIKSITVDYGDGTGEGAVSLNPVVPSASVGSAAPNGAQVVSPTSTVPPSALRTIGFIPLQHLYSHYGTYTVQVKIVDVDGDSYEGSFRVQVADVPPTVQLQPVPNVYVGTACTLQGKIIDPGTDTWTVEVDFRDYSTPYKTSINSNTAFSVSHTYICSGIYDISVAARDDGGSAGDASEQVQVMIPGGGGGGGVASSVYHDATLHSLFLENTTLQQDDGAYTGTGFDPKCHHYTISGIMGILHVVATADPKAKIQYTINGGTAADLPQNTSTMVDMPAGTLTIVVTAPDGVTTSTYTVSE